MSTPATTARLDVAPCPFERWWSCALQGSHGYRIFLHPEQRRRLVLYHEVGHLADWTDISPDAEREFRRRFVGDRARPAEKLASAYALCSRSRRTLPRRWRVQYNWEPSRRTHRRACRFLVRVLDGG